MKQLVVKLSELKFTLVSPCFLSQTSMFLHVELSVLLIKSASRCTVSSAPSKGLVWFLRGIWALKEGTKGKLCLTGGPLAGLNYAVGGSLILLWDVWDWASHWEVEKTGRIHQNGAILERADFSCSLSLLWKTS